MLKYLEQIEEYYENRLSEADKVEFEKKLNSDPELKAEFELYITIVNGIKSAGRSKLKSALDLADTELDNTNKEANHSKLNFKYSHLALAASILLLIGFFFVFNNSGNRLDDLAKRYYEKEKGLPVEMGDNLNELSALMNKYKIGDYKNALILIYELQKKNPNNDTLIYFEAICNLELRKYPQTYSLLTSISESSTYYQKAQYRLILVDLFEGKKEQALKTIDVCLLDTNFLYFDKLNALKKELSNK